MDSKQTKPLRAVALGYREGTDSAPRILASGQGLLAEKIIAVARQNDVVLREDASLVAGDGDHRRQYRHSAGAICSCGGSAGIGVSAEAELKECSGDFWPDL
jgi:FlhB HrpN YscU SpaS Family